MLLTHARPRAAPDRSALLLQKQIPTVPAAAPTISLMTIDHSPYPGTHVHGQKCSEQARHRRKLHLSTHPTWDWFSFARDLGHMPAQTWPRPTCELKATLYRAHSMSLAVVSSSLRETMHRIRGVPPNSKRRLSEQLIETRIAPSSSRS